MGQAFGCFGVVGRDTDDVSDENGPRRGGFPQGRLETSDP